MRLKRLAACILAGAMTMSVALTGCGNAINADEVGATLNGKEISMGFLNFVARYQQAESDLSLLPYFGTGMWNSPAGDGVTMEQSIKEQVLTNVETWYLLEEHMADYGVAITEDELTAMEDAAKKFISGNSKKAIKQMGATEEYVKEYLRLCTIEEKMRDAIYADTEVVVTDEEAAQRTFSYFRAEITTDKEAAEKLATTMKELAVKAKEDFEGTAKANGYTVYNYSYGVEEKYMDKEVIAVADALKEGEISDVITTEDFYYIIRMDSEYDEKATATEKESMINAKKSEAYQAICDGYIEAATFDVNKKEWAKVKFDRLFKAVVSEEKATK